jgi:hypothetical protein
MNPELPQADAVWSASSNDGVKHNRRAGLSREASSPASALDSLRPKGGEPESLSEKAADFGGGGWQARGKVQREMTQLRELCRR